MESNHHKRQEAAPRATEYKTSVSTFAKSKGTHVERSRGRPLGSKNKPHALVPKELASEFLGVVKGILPPEYYNDMKDAIRNGKNISTVNEAKILLKLMGPPIWLRLIEETKPLTQSRPRLDQDLANEIGPEPESPIRAFDKDLNERLKVMIQMLQFVARLEGEDDESDNSQKPILEIIARRGLDSERIKFLVGVESGDVGGSPDGTGRQAIEVRAVSDKLPERPLDIQDSQQE